MDNYCIKDSNYKINAANLTLDSVSGEIYWTRSRILKSCRDQIPVYQKALEIAQKNGLKKILDIGCGSAVKLNRLFDSSFELYGVDQEAAIEYCRQHYKRGQYFVDNFEQPSFSLKRNLQYADLIICSDVIEHLADPGKLLSYIKHFWGPKTFLVISTPDRVSLGRRSALKPLNVWHIREWSKEEFSDYLQESGFEILEHLRVAPFNFLFDFRTLKHYLEKFVLRAPFDHTQVAVCKMNT